MNQFDQMINRYGTNSLKYDFAKERNYPQDVLPLWVADMDFQAPQEVLHALSKAVDHGIFGYQDTKDDYAEVIIQWFAKSFSWTPQKEWLVKSPGVVFAIATAISAFTQEGDSVLIQRPVYYPFSQVILAKKRKLVNNALVCKNGQYEIDFEDFEKKIIENKVKLFLFCSPHNPVGRVWTHQELIHISEICLKHHVLVVADEIHCDFTYPGYSHIPYASLSSEATDQSIICTAPSKTFNLAGLQVSNIFIKNPTLRTAFQDAIFCTGYSELNGLGLTACQAAYQYGESWLHSLKEYLLSNLNFVRNFLHTYLPDIRLIEPQGTYLIWLDFHSLGLTDKQLEHFIVHKAKLWLDAGSIFGPEGAQFERINIACPQKTLEQAFNRLKEAISLL